MMSISDCFDKDGAVDMEKFLRRRRLQRLDYTIDTETEVPTELPIMHLHDCFTANGDMHKSIQMMMMIAATMRK
jgi:hypothetical protein